MVLKQTESSFDLVFTITDVPPVEGLGDILPIEATRPLDECYQKLADSVNSGNFVINVRSIFQTSLEVSYVQPCFFTILS